MSRLLLTISATARATARALHRRIAGATLSLAALAALPAGALANITPPDLQFFVQSQAIGSLSAAPAAGAAQARVEVTLGQLDPRLQLAPCARIEPFIPANARLWGRSHVGLRCTQGATWSVQLPVTVRVYGPALVATRPLSAHAPVSPEDFTVAEVEWTRESQGVVTDAAQLDNRVPTRPIGVGQPVPLVALRAPVVISAGDPVKVLGQGRGFAVSADAIALAAAQDGQPVRVRTDSGRVLTGTARSGRRVEVSF
ncbi:MAG: flagellar basal body P-ring formation protein FlgA [Burkholderiaceae bacterium]|jgi:flagella basal body P-ring formation protein FlgA|nr:flagellar basal body P-ring formation protein FlgA [Burkholderiaceae bacterium]